MGFYRYPPEVERELAELDASEARREGEKRRCARAKLKSAGTILALDYSERQLLNIQEYEFNAAQRAAQEQAMRRRWAEQAKAQHRARVTAALRPAGIQFRSALVEQLCTHAIELVIAHGLEVRRQNDGNAEAYAEQKMIAAPAVTNERNYGLVLHEVAHVVDPESDSRQFDYAIRNHTMSAPDAEVNAWSWTVRNALTWTNSMQAVCFDGLLSYAHGATLEQRDRMAVFVSNSAFKIRDRGWTAEEFTEKSAQLRADTTTLHTKAATAPDDTIADREARARLSAVESKLDAWKHCGTWNDRTPYTAGNEVAFNGCAWLALADSVGIRPGTSRAWQLRSKAGRDGKDAR